MNEASDTQLKYSYWYVLNKAKLKKIGIIVFGLFDCLLIGFCIYGVVDAAVNYKKEKELFANINSIRLTPTDRPGQLQILNPLILTNGLSKYDLVVKIRNANDNWLAVSLTYHFVVNNNTNTPTQKSFLLNNEEKYLSILGYQNLTPIKNITVQIDEVSWRRVAQTPILKAIDFKISDIKLNSSSQLSGQTGDYFNQVSFKVLNNSIYNFWEAGFQIVLLGSQNNVLAINNLKISNLQSFQDRFIEVSFFNIKTHVSKVLVLPDIDIFDPGNYQANSLDGSGR
jgi:hypothetical protein